MNPQTDLPRSHIDLSLDGLIQGIFSLILVDSYSKCLEIMPIKSVTIGTVISAAIRYSLLMAYQQLLCPGMSSNSLLLNLRTFVMISIYLIFTLNINSMLWMSKSVTVQRNNFSIHKRLLIYPILGTDRRRIQPYLRWSFGSPY